MRATIAMRGRGRFEVAVSQSEVDEIARALDDAGWSDLPDEVDGLISDMPTVTIAYRGRTVRFLRGAGWGRIDDAIKLVYEIAFREPGRE